MADNDKTEMAPSPVNGNAASEGSPVRKLNITEELQVRGDLTLARRMLSVALDISVKDVETLDAQVALAERQIARARAILGESLTRREDAGGE